MNRPVGVIIAGKTLTARSQLETYYFHVHGPANHPGKSCKIRRTSNTCEIERIMSVGIGDTIDIIIFSNEFTEIEKDALRTRLNGLGRATDFATPPAIVQANAT